MILTAEQIVQRAEKAIKTQSNLAIRRQMNKLFREQDDSHLWPVSGAFNVTERCIRRANKMERANGEMSPLEYAYFIEAESSTIVNSEV